MNKKTKNKIIVLAHRGLKDDLFENSFHALIESSSLKEIDGIELDVRETKDKKVVVFHDRTLKRLFKRKIRIKKHTYKELIKITNDKIPLLEDILYFIPKNTIINIELKETNPKKVYSIVKKYFKKFGYEKIIFSSYNIFNLIILKLIDSKVNVSILSFDPIIPILFLFLRPYSINLPTKIVDKSLVLFYHFFKQKIFVYTIKNKRQFKRLKKYNIDGVIIDSLDYIR